MSPYNVPNIIPVSTVMNATINSSPQQIWFGFAYSIQVVFTGTPTGIFKLQASADAAEKAVVSGNLPSTFNWTDVDNSSFTVAAAGNVMWNYMFPGYNWVRVVYTDNSGGTSTAIITSSTFNGKSS